MEKVSLKSLLDQGAYVGPKFSSSKKKNILAQTIYKKNSFLTVMRKHFVEIVLSMVLVGVIGYNLEYVQNIGQPLVIDHSQLVQENSISLSPQPEEVHDEVAFVDTDEVVLDQQLDFIDGTESGLDFMDLEESPVV